MTPRVGTNATIIKHYYLCFTFWNRRRRTVTTLLTIRWPTSSSRPVSRKSCRAWTTHVPSDRIRTAYSRVTRSANTINRVTSFACAISGHTWRTWSTRWSVIRVRARDGAEAVVTARERLTSVPAPVASVAFFTMQRLVPTTCNSSRCVLNTIFRL